VTSTTSEAISDQLETMARALTLATPWLKACAAGDVQAAELIGSELIIGGLSPDHALLLQGLSAVAVSVLVNLPDPVGYLDGLLAAVEADVSAAGGI
jgi:hypothetical protein